jgi:hypothetical protein
VSKVIWPAGNEHILRGGHIFASSSGECQRAGKRATTTACRNGRPTRSGRGGEATTGAVRLSTREKEGILTFSSIYLLTQYNMVGPYYRGLMAAASLGRLS